MLTIKPVMSAILYGNWTSWTKEMIEKLSSAFRSNRLGRYVRGHISSWPGYQFVPDTGVFHKPKLRFRAGASFISETLRETPETRKRRRSVKMKRNTERGEILLLGNGPSVNNLTIQQILRFQSYGGKIAVMNGFLFSDLSEKFLPDYYFIVDPAYWRAEDREGTALTEKLKKYIEEINTDCVLVQPGSNPLLSEKHLNYFFVDGRTIAGLLRIAQPNRPWGLPSSVAMMAISALKYVGFETIYFAGLDSNSYKDFFVDDLNKVMFSAENNYFFRQGDRHGDATSKLFEEARPMRDWPIRHMSDVLYAAAIFMRDLHWLAGENCINVGGDRTNDSAPRACLLK